MPRATLTDTFLKKKTIVPAEGQRDYWDKLLPGFGIRCSYAGRKTFTVLTRINGKLERISVGSYPAVTLADARKKARCIIEDAAKGISPKQREARARLEEQTKTRGTFAAVVQEFMASHGKNLRTGVEMARYFDVELLPAWADRPIADITRADVKELIRQKAKTAPVSANRLASLISRLFNWCLKEEIVTTSPAMRLDRQPESPRERSLTADEIAILWPAFTKLGFPFGPALQLLLTTGQRRGEVTGLRWADIDFASNTWKLPSASSKNARGHSIPLSTLALEILADCPHLGDHVFTAGRGWGAVKGWHRAKLRLAAMALAVEPWTVHDLRRTTATMMRSIGVDRSTVSKILNHSEPGMTARVYDQYLADPEKIAAMERWAGKLRQIIDGDTGGNVVPMTKTG